MLIKKELQNLPLTSAPDPTKKVPLTAGAKIHQLPHCGRILALDVYQQRKLLFRFFSDGKNCITWSEHPGKPGWTKKNLFRFDGIKYQAISIKPCSAKRISRILKTNPSSLNVLHQTEECVGEFIERFHKQKKEKARDAKYRLMEQHLDMFPAYPDDLDEFCESHVFHKSIVYLTKLEKSKRWGRCMHCGRAFLLDRSVKPGSEGTCPKCSFPVRFRGERATKPIVEKAKICIPSRVDGQLLLRYTDVRRVISPDEREPEFDYSDFFLNIVVEKAGRQKAYAYWWRSYPYYWSGWSRLKNGSGCYSYTYVYTENLTEVFGEQYCHVDLQAGLRDLLRPIDFAGLLRNLQNIPQAEYLFKLGLPGLAAGLSLKESGAASFSELTGVSKQYLPILRETQAGKPDLQFCRSLETGVITMNNEVIRKVSSQYDMKIDDEHIANVLQGKEKYLPNEVKEEIFTAARLHANDILNQLRELQVDLRSNPAIFIGGGSILLQPYLSESSLAGKAEFIDSPNANALGYEMLGEKQLARLRG